MSIPIDARERWNRTGIRVRTGDRLLFAASGTWYDRGIPATAGGYAIATARWSSRLLLRLFWFFKRVPRAPWLALIVTVDEDLSTAFAPFKLDGAPKDGATWIAPRDGELCAFANDHSLTYGNNTGNVSLTITRVP